VLKMTWMYGFIQYSSEQIAKKNYMTMRKMAETYGKRP
jgi:hypothetical protein